MLHINIFFHWVVCDHSLFIIVILLCLCGTVKCHVTVDSTIPDLLISTEENVFSNSSHSVPKSTFGGSGTLILSSPNFPDWMDASLSLSNYIGAYGTTGFGYCVFVDEFSNIAFAGDSVDGLLLLNITDLTNPTRLGNISVGLNNFRDILVWEEIAYICESSGFYSNDVTDSTSPTQLGHLAEFSDPRSLFYDANQGVAFVTDYEYGFRIVNVSEPSQMTIIANFSISDTGVFDIFVQDNIALVGCTSSCQIVDISDLKNPFLVSTYSGVENSARSVVIDNRLGYIADESKGMKIIDLDSSPQPILLGEFVHNLFEITNIFMRGGYIYAFGSNGFYILDVSSNTADPKILGEYVLGLESYYISVKDNYAFINHLEDGIRIYVFGESLEMTQISPSPCGFHDTVIIEAYDVFKNSNSTSFVVDIPLCMCFGSEGNDTSQACHSSSNGICIFNDTCDCNDHYHGLECGVTSCYSIMTNESSLLLCSGNGDCVSYDQCQCDTEISEITGSEFLEYYGEECQFPAVCDNLTFYHAQVCSGHGECHIDGNCTCQDGYDGSFCDMWGCWNISKDDIDVVCGGHGLCFSSDSCFCLSSYFSEYVGGECSQYYCGEYLVDDSQNVCSERGTCISSNECDCHDDYEGDDCETWSCGEPYNSPYTCSGRGECLAPDECDCDSSGYEGVHCGSLTSGAVAGIVVPLVLLSVAATCCFVCCVLVCSVLLVLCGMCFCSCVCVYVVRQAWKVKEFGKLKNFDILLREQELEEDTTIAHVRIQKSLYEIPFDEIIVKKLLGEGGSASVVFKALWKNKVVAFKCFKTRLVCSNQDKFDEFETEVQVLSSLKHPYIVQFYGATLKPPRVGIIMEYCENGDLRNFLETYKNNNENREYDQNEKIRMCYEISLSMGYLHSKSIIHRDLKTENILVNQKEETKLMDFGVSKIIDEISDARTKKIGTNVYMAPEVVSDIDGGYNEKIDVYSFAILVYIIMTENENPYGKQAMMVELKVSSDPTYRPDILELDKKLSLDNKWIGEICIRNWSHGHKERQSFFQIARFFEKMSEELDAKKSELLEIEEEEEEGEEDDDRGEYIDDEEGLLDVLKEKSDFDGDENYYHYLKTEIESVQKRLLDWGKIEKEKTD